MTIDSVTSLHPAYSRLRRDRRLSRLTSVSSRGMTLTELVTSSPVTVTRWQFCSSEGIVDWPSRVTHECTYTPRINMLASTQTTTVISLPPDATLARYTLSSCVRLFVCLSVRPSQAGIVSKRLDESSWFLARRPLSVYPTLRCKEIWVSPKLGYFPLELCPKLRN